MHSLIFVAELILLELRTKSFGKQKLHQNDKNFEYFDSSGQFEALFFSNWTYIVTKAHQNNEFSQALGVLTL